MSKKRREEGAGMRSATMPKEHWERKEPNLSTCDEKYASEFGNPEDLQKGADGLANYVRTHKMKQ